MERLNPEGLDDPVEAVAESAAAMMSASGSGAVAA
jgi:hypothetical protein